MDLQFRAYDGRFRVRHPQAGPTMAHDDLSKIPRRRNWGQRALDFIEWAGNKLPDPAALFLAALLLTWGASWLLAPVEFREIDPRTTGVNADGTPRIPQTIAVKDQRTGPALVTFLSRLVKTFVEFPPLGVVLVALLGVGVAEHTGFIGALVKGMLAFTPARLLTPMVLLVAIISHSAGDTGYVLVVPLGGVIFSVAGRHPLAGIAAAFAGVAGGFSANFLPSGLDPLLQGFTQAAAQMIDPTRLVNPLCNWAFTSASSLLVIGLGWWITDRIIEPRLSGTAVDTPPAELPRLDPLRPAERRGLAAGLATLAVLVGLLVAAASPPGSPFRSATGELFGHGSPLMESIVPLIFLLFLTPGTVYGYVAGTVHSHRDIVQAMSKSMSTMGYYLVMAFFAAQFTAAFRDSNIGALVAIKGAAFLKSLALPSQATVAGVIGLSAAVNLLIGSASAKWALLGPIFVPMLMELGISPELTQAAYRIGDSCTNIVTPLMPYFPLVVAFCRQYVKQSGVGTLISLMTPYSLIFLAGWTLLLLGWWWARLPLGLQGGYSYP
jgi:aminobenzoyl-glutamate transport protein